ncbi:site-2 protease family protein [Candidatus Latescibacterota bacterium]
MLYRKIIIHPSDGYFQDYTDVVRTPEPNVRLHIILFVLTLMTTTCCGSFLADRNPFSSLEGFVAGFPFSLTLLGILGVHEFGHYFASRRWRVNVTLPYFIPFPFPPIGTFGAVIKMRSSIPNRKALVDIGTAGPLAGFVVSIVATIIGLHYSTILPVEATDASFSYILGESLMFKFLTWVTLGSLAENQNVILHPMAFAGWLGFFVTALNLIPFGQLDGGHILFAVSPRTHDLFRRIRIPLLLLFGITFWSGWFVWAIILLILGSRHPYPDFSEPDIGTRRHILAALALIIFVLCIIPMPVRVG